jgi:hypothetical protein
MDRLGPIDGRGGSANLHNLRYISQMVTGPELDCVR